MSRPGPACTAGVAADPGTRTGMHALGPGDNPYFDQFSSIEIEGMAGICAAAHLRGPMVRRFGFSVPTIAALNAVAAWAPIIEIGAGGGYWAALLRARGVQVRAYDLAPPGTGGSEFTVAWTKIRAGGIEALAHHPDHTLMLGWPPYESDMAARALAAYPGRRLVYIGEGAGGCCADDAFFALRGREFEQVATVALPRWPAIHDHVSLWERRTP